MIGLLGACAVLVVLVEAPDSTGGSPGSGAMALSPSSALPVLHSPVPVLHSAALTPAERTGTHLMSQAEISCGSVTFHGLQVTAWWGAASQRVSFLEVWHRPGGAIVAEPSDLTGSADEDRPRTSGMPQEQEVMTITAPLLALMRANYVLTYRGRDAIAGRPTVVVEARRRDGSLAARFWLDSATKLPLERELYNGKSQLFSRDAFIRVSVGAGQLRGMPPPDAQPWTGQLSARNLTAMRAAGWPLPQAMAAGLTLFQATETTKSGQVVELSYSDGLSVTSVFVQRGELPRSMPGWQRLTARGRQVYARDPDDRSLAWSSRGFVYTVISDAPTATIDQVILRLPHDSPAGFWERMGRGLRRIVSWANPFR
jgi:sigma-E factor negative regulatory protein RseB